MGVPLLSSTRAPSVRPTIAERPHRLHHGRGVKQEPTYRTNPSVPLPYAKEGPGAFFGFGGAFASTATGRFQAYKRFGRSSAAVPRIRSPGTSQTRRRFGLPHHDHSGTRRLNSAAADVSPHRRLSILDCGLRDVHRRSKVLDGDLSGRRHRHAPRAIYSESQDLVQRDPLGNLFLRMKFGRHSS